jgi:hypothetical protein
LKFGVINIHRPDDEGSKHVFTTWRKIPEDSYLDEL